MAYEKQTWADGVTPLDAEHLNHMEQGISQLSSQIANLPTSGSGSGLSSNAKTLLIAILRNAIYSSDQSVNITELESELESTSGGGSGGSGTVKYTVENNLTNVTSDNTKALIDANASYIATLSADEGFVLDVVTVTMGGEDVTAAVYADGVITIPAVTGDVVITATAVVISNDLLASATWTDSLRANSSGEWTNQTSWFGSSLISCEPSGTITITINEGITGQKSVEWAFYDANQSKIKGVGGSQLLSNTSETYPNTYSITAPEGASYIRFSLQKTSGSMDVYISAMKS